MYAPFYESVSENEKKKRKTTNNWAFIFGIKGNLDKRLNIAIHTLDYTSNATLLLFIISQLFVWRFRSNLEYDEMSYFGVFLKISSQSIYWKIKIISNNQGYCKIKSHKMTLCKIITKQFITLKMHTSKWSESLLVLLE